MRVYYLQQRRRNSSELGEGAQWSVSYKGGVTHIYMQTTHLCKESIY